MTQSAPKMRTYRVYLSWAADVKVVATSEEAARNVVEEKFLGGQIALRAGAVKTEILADDGG